MKTSSRVFFYKKKLTQVYQRVNYDIEILLNGVLYKERYEEEK